MIKTLMKHSLLLMISGLMIACGASGQVLYQVDHYDQKYKKSLIRLALYVEAQSDAHTEQLLQLWGIQTQRYINQHRDFLLKEIAGSEIPKDIDFQALNSKSEDIKELCVPEIQGVIYLKGKVLPQDQKMKLSMQSELYDCEKQNKLWVAKIDDIWESKDQTVESVIKMYENEIGKEVYLYIAPSFHAIRLLFEQLPYPKMTLDRDIKDKIEMR
jgi:probable lipoprotein (TIGR04455 family)